MIKKIIALLLCAVSLAHSVRVQIAHIRGVNVPLAQYTTRAALNNALKTPLQNPGTMISIIRVNQKHGSVASPLPAIVGRFLNQSEFNQLIDGDTINVY